MLGRCMGTPKLRRYALAAFVSPIAASLVCLIGLFYLADMNPANEYGASYVPTGKEHDPTNTDFLLWLVSTALTFLATALICIKVQKAATGVFGEGNAQSTRG